MPTPGTPSSCDERTFRCKAVEHTVEVRCENDSCRVADARTSPSAPGVRSSALVFTKPGFMWITATFDPAKGKARTERVQVDVRKPDRVVAQCSAKDISLALYAGDVELRGEHAQLAVTLPDGTKCERLAIESGQNAYRCPSQPTTVHVAAPDFEVDTAAGCS
jgi:hypothetical protein